MTDIEKLIADLEREGSPLSKQAAVTLNAIFNPENQPSQFGTVLWRSGDEIPRRFR